MDVETCLFNCHLYKHLRTGIKLFICSLVYVHTKLNIVRVLYDYMTHVCTIFIQHGLLFVEMVSKLYYPVCVCAVGLSILVLFVCMCICVTKGRRA